MRHPFESIPLDAVPGSYVESPTRTTVPEVEFGATSHEYKWQSGDWRRSAGIIFLSVGVGALFAIGTHIDASRRLERGEWA